EGAHSPRHSVVAETLEEVSGAATADLDLGERGEVEERRRLATRPMLRLDCRRPQSACPTAGAQRLVAAGSSGLEPVGPLPSRLLPERRAELLQTRVGRRKPQRPSGGAFVTGVFDVVVGRVD